MSVKLNASTTSGLVVDSDLTGSLKLQTGGNDAFSIDNSQVANFTKQFQIGGILPPAFSAYHSTTQSLSGSAFTYINFDSEDFDTNSNFASSTFTPTVAGYYQLSACVRTNGAPTNEFSIFLFKGSNNIRIGSTAAQGSGILASTISTLVYANGTTDAFRIGMYCGSSCSTAGNSIYTWFTGALIRAA
jgi:hypothetical protein